VSTLIVVNNQANWPFDIPEVDVVSARAYLTDTRYSELKGVRVFNLCRSYAYQDLGYYVSLLATARGHKVLPSISTIQDIKSQTIIRFVSGDLHEVIQKDLAHLQSDEFILSIYFGRNVAKRYDRLSLKLFHQFRAPMLRAHFTRDGEWTLRNISPIPTNEVPEAHRPYLLEFAQEYLTKGYTRPTRRAGARYDLAILANVEEETAPSDERALKKFIKAAASLGIRAELVTKDDYGRIAEYDGLFIRETTAVNHHTYRFAQRAQAEGLVVIDDPESIVRCTNKVYLAEALTKQNIPIPKTLVVHRDNVEEIEPTLGFPCILKRPDSSSSQGVIKVENHEELKEGAELFLAKSELFVAQEFLPTEFDWRVGVIDNEPLFVCKYHMAPKHWQIINWQQEERRRYGTVETMPVEVAPKTMVKVAVRAARQFGNGLYGVDLKQVGKTPYVIEVNDNPSIESGYEDKFLKDELYWRIMWVFLQRIEKRKLGSVRA